MCITTGNVCDATEFAEMTQIQVLFPVHFPLREAFFEGRNTVHIVTLDVHLCFSRLPHVFYFSCLCVLTILSECSLLPPPYVPTTSPPWLSCRAWPIPDVYMTSRLLVLGSAHTFTLSVLHTHARAGTRTRIAGSKKDSYFSLELPILRVIKSQAWRRNFVGIV